MAKGKHRVPPKPRHMLSAKPGQCKFCGDPIFKAGKVNKRATWHPQCALKWTIMNSSRDARRFVFIRDRGICKSCGMNCAPDDGNPETVARLIEQIMTPPGKRANGIAPPLRLGVWELDHIIPLSQAPALGNPPHLWQLGNMQTLCHGCHSEKTKADRLLYGNPPQGCSKGKATKERSPAPAYDPFAEGPSHEAVRASRKRPARRQRVAAREARALQLD